MRARRSAAVLLGVLVALVAFLAVEAHGHAERTRADAQRSADARAVRQIASDLDELLATSSQLRRTVDAVGLVAARQHFGALTQRVLDLPVVTSVALEEAVPADGRRAFERASGLRIGRPGSAPASLPSLVVSSALSTEVAGSSLWGLDVFVDPQRRAVLRSAFATGAARATPPVSGLRRIRAGLSLYLPLDRRPGKPMPDVIGVSLDVAKLGPELAASLPAGTQVAIADGGHRIAGTGPRVVTDASRPYSFGGRSWMLSASAPAPPRSNGWLTLLVGGLAGAVLLSLGVWRLLARLERSSDERRALAERIGDLFTHSPLGLMVTDAEHRVVEVNPALELLVGSPADALLGRSVRELIDPRDHAEVTEVVDDLAAGRTATLSGEIRLRRADGSVVWTQLTATPQRTPDGGLSGLLLQAHDIESRRSEHAQLQQLAERDPLTGALNRRSFDARLAAHAARWDGGPVPGALFVVDLDRFKEVNDTHGHAAGDRLLCAVADVLRECLRQGDALARLGGDEFAFLLAGPTDHAGFEEVALRVRTAVTEQVGVEVDGVRVGVGASIGWAAFDAADGGQSVTSAFEAADAAMYAAKRGGVLR